MLGYLIIYKTNRLSRSVTLIDSIVRKAHQTVSVCTAKIGESLDNIKTNLLNVLRDEMENVTLVCEMESAKSKNTLEKISNTSLHMVEQFSSGEALKILINVVVISQSLLNVHGFRKDAGFDCLTFWKNIQILEEGMVCTILQLHHQNQNLYTVI